MGLLASLTWADSLLSQTRAFIEFRTNILRPTDFSQFDNVSGAGREIIPNYVHYIRLQQPEIRWDGTKKTLSHIASTFAIQVF